MSGFFKIRECDHKSCMYYEAGSKCWLHCKLVGDHVNTIGLMHNSEICQARDQTNNYRTEALLRDESG